MASERSLRDRVKEALDGIPEIGAKAGYLEALRENLTGIERKIQTHLKIALLAIVAFELLVRASVAELSVGPLKLTDFSLAQKLLPAALAYSYNQLASLYAFRIIIRQIHDEGMRYLAKPIFDADLEYFVLPHSWFLAEDAFERYTGSSLFSNVTMPIKAAIVFLPLAFLAYAYHWCFVAFGRFDTLIWVSLVGSVLLVGQGLLFFFWGPHQRSA